MVKKLDSILSMAPYATAKESVVAAQHSNVSVVIKNNDEKLQRIVAVVPKSIKRQVKSYIEENPGETERTVILRGLKALGLTVDPSLLIDNRTRR